MPLHRAKKRPWNILGPIRVSVVSVWSRRKEMRSASAHQGRRSRGREAEPPSGQKRDGERRRTSRRRSDQGGKGSGQRRATGRRPCRLDQRGKVEHRHSRRSDPGDAGSWSRIYPLLIMHRTWDQEPQIAS